MPKAKIDHNFCLTAMCEPGKRKTTFWDDTIIGLTLEVRPNGATFFLRYMNEHGAQKCLKIARYGDASVAEIRKLAAKLRSEVVLGGDPMAAKQAKKEVPLYAAVAEQHITHAKTYQRSWWSTEGLIRTHLLPRLGRKRLDEITKQEVAALLAEKSQEGLKPATVEKIRVVLGRTYSLASDWQIPGAETNPARGISRPKFDNKRQRYLSGEETGRLLNACRAGLNPQLPYIVGLLLLTGARVSELLHAEWRHINLERQAWLIPMSKTGKARHVPLSQAAIDIIRQLPRFKDCPYLVPNPETKLPYVSIKHSWQTARKAAGLQDLHIHDLRHSAASFMINAGIDLYAVGRVLGHADHKSTVRYSHLANDTLLAAVEAGAARMNQIDHDS